MFLHQVKMNWKMYRKSAHIVLLLAAGDAFLKAGFGWAPLAFLATLKLALGVLAATVVCAFVRTLWELGTAYCKKLCTFIVALRKFCRDYWSSKTTAVYYRGRASVACAEGSSTSWPPGTQESIVSEGDHQLNDSRIGSLGQDRYTRSR